MTKAVTVSAVMMLVEDGTLTLDAPAERWLPEIANRRVLRQTEGPLTDTVPARRPITVRDLLSFTLGSASCSITRCRSSAPSTRISWSTARRCP